jgi:hypothetical protein
MEIPADLTAGVRNILSRYVDAKNQFLATSKRCVIKGWPDKKEAINNANRMGVLQGELEILRFDFLASAVPVDQVLFRSLASIMDRIYKDWKDSEETALRNKSAAYREMVSETEALKAKLIPKELDGPFADVLGDPEYRSAANMFRMKYHEFDGELGKLVSANQHDPSKS